MTADVSPLQVLLVTFAGWINRHQQHVIEYLVAENRVFKGQLTGRRLRLTDERRHANGGIAELLLSAGCRSRHSSGARIPHFRIKASSAQEE